MKASIRKPDGGAWTLTRPPYGLRRDPEVTEHESWKAARQALLGDAPAGAGPIVERGQHTLKPVGVGGWPRHGTIRMEDTE